MPNHPVTIQPLNRATNYCMPKPFKLFEAPIANGTRQTHKVMLVCALPVPAGYPYSEVPPMSLPLTQWLSEMGVTARPFYVRKTFLRDNAARLSLPGNEPFELEGVRPYNVTEL